MFSFHCGVDDSGFPCLCHTYAEPPNKAKRSKKSESQKSSLLLGFSGSVDCTLIILHLTAHVQFKVSTHHVCLSGSGLLYSG